MLDFEMIYFRIYNVGNIRNILFEITAQVWA